MFFQQGALNVPQIPRFSSCFHFQFSKQTNQTVVFTVFWQDNMQKTTMFWIFRIFSARARQVKNQSFFAAFLPPLIQTQEGVKSPKIAKLHLNLTFYLSQSLLQSSNPWNWGSLFGPKSAVNYDVLWTYHAFYLQNKAPPPAKADLC